MQKRSRQHKYAVSIKRLPNFIQVFHFVHCGCVFQLFFEKLVLFAKQNVQFVFPMFVAAVATSAAAAAASAVAAFFIHTIFSKLLFLFLLLLSTSKGWFVFFVVPLLPFELLLLMWLMLGKNKMCRNCSKIFFRTKNKMSKNKTLCNGDALWMGIMPSNISVIS
jgi:hypothetical protein